MGRFDTTKATINANIKSNGNQEITGYVLNSVLQEMVDGTDAQLTELSKKTGISLIANNGGTKPNIFQEGGIWYLDFGDDTILLVGNTQYVFVQLHSDISKFRKIPLNHDSGTSAVKVVFNLDSATFYTKHYAENLTDNEVLIGGIRYSYTGNILFNFPFEYTINGQEQWDADIEKIKTETSEVIGANLRRNFVLISSIGQPKPNIVNSQYLDMGEDPVVCVNNKYYILNAIDSKATYRKISLLDIGGSSTSAVILVFNTESAKLYCRSFTSVLAENEIEVGGIRRGDVLVANLPFEYTINGKELWEIGASDEPSEPEENPQSVDELRKHINVSLIADIQGSKPNVFQEGGVWYLDFGSDSVLLVGNTQYALVQLHSDTSKFRKIPLNHESGTSAIKVVFNLDSATFYTKHYSETLANNEVLIGGLRNSPYTGETLFNFPFEYTIRGKEQWETSQGSNTGDVRQLRCKTAMTFMAHRGLHLNGIPENSLDAYRYAARCGFDYAETDFQVTSDGELVLMHNESINATMRNAADYSEITETINVSEHTLADLRENYVLASSDVRMRKPIPTLEEYFITCRNSGIFPVPEIKAFGMSNEQIKKAHDLGCAIMGEGNFGFCSFSAEYLDYARTLSEKTILCYIMSGGIVGTNNSVTGNSRVSPTTWWYPTWDAENYGDYGVTLENVRRHKEAGVKVAVWTTPVSQFDNLLKKEVDCISTDDICPSIDGLVGKVATSDNGFSDFETTGYESNGRLILSAGQTCRFNAGSMWLGGYYLSIIGKGNFTISAPNLNVTISNSKTDRYIYQGLVNNQIGELTITANSSTELEFVEFSCVNL